MLIHFQVNMADNGRNNIFKDKQTTNQVPLMFLDVKVLSQRWQLRFWTVSTIEEGAVHVFSV